MKKILALSLVFATLAVGCTDASGSSNERFIQTGAVTVSGHTDFKVYTDTQTGCHYMYAIHSFTPLFDKDGKVEGCGQIQAVPSLTPQQLDEIKKKYDLK